MTVPMSKFDLLMLWVLFQGTVWRLVYGLLTSHNAMFSTLALIVLTLYIFACLGVESWWRSYYFVISWFVLVLPYD